MKRSLTNTGPVPPPRRCSGCLRWRSSVASCRSRCRWYCVFGRLPTLPIVSGNLSNDGTVRNRFMGEDLVIAQARMDDLHWRLRSGGDGNLTGRQACLWMSCHSSEYGSGRRYVRPARGPLEALCALQPPDSSWQPVLAFENLSVRLAAVFMLKVRYALDRPLGRYQSLAVRFSATGSGRSLELRIWHTSWETDFRAPPLVPSI